MTASPPELAELLDIGRQLGDDETLNTVTALTGRESRSRLRVLVIGSSGSGRASVTNLILGDGLLPESPLPKTAVEVELRYSDTPSLTCIGANNDRTEVPQSSLSRLLLGDVDPSCRLLELRGSFRRLLDCDLHVASLEGRSPDEWRRVLSSTDYVVLILNAAALLSEAERRFVRDLLAIGFGLERVAIVVNQMDRVAPEERDSLLELVRVFLGTFESQPPLLGLSARRAKIPEAARESGLEALMTLVEDLVARRAEIRSAALNESLAAILERLEAIAKEQDALESMAQSDVERVRGEIARRSDWIDERIDRSQKRIIAYIETLLKEDLLRRVEDFGERFRARLPLEVDSVPDLASVRRHLPGYIEAVWREFLRGELIRANSELARETAKLDETIVADLRELLSSTWPSPSSHPDLDLDFSRHVFLLPGRGSHRARTAARGLSVQGYVFLFLSPPLGVVSLVASHALSKAFAIGIDEAHRKAIVEGAAKASKELERDVKEFVEKQFVGLTDRLVEGVEGTYREGVSRLVESLETRLDNEADIAARRELIKSIRFEKLPRLRSQLLKQEASMAG